MSRNSKYREPVAELQWLDDAINLILQSCWTIIVAACTSAKEIVYFLWGLLLWAQKLHDKGKMSR
jgi:hypothetical protein